MGERQRILVVDDEPNIRQIVETRLKLAGFDVSSAVDGLDALAKAEAIQPHLVVLDVMMPHMDGREVCAELRRRMATPIIMLTAKGDIGDRIQALDGGADDYLIKPFSPRELEARIRAVLRRVTPNPEAQKSAPILLDGLSIDPAKRQVLKDGQKVKLTEMEFSLLELLASHPGKAFSRAEVLKSVWGYRANQGSDTRVVDVHVSRLRSKLEPDPSNPELILTARGTGYMFQSLRGDAAHE